MKIFINHTPVDIDEGITLEQLIARQGISEKGTAVAIDNRVVTRTLWAETRIEEGAKITIIQAVCGG